MKSIVLVILSGLTCSNWVYGKCQDSYKLKEANDISKVVSCEEITGDLEVTGNFNGQLKLEKLKKVHGSIKVNAKNVGMISFDNLETVVKDIEFKDIFSVSGISLPKLNSVNKLLVDTIGGDYAIKFEPGLKNINILEIFDTRISKLQGIRAERIGNVKVNGVPELTELDLSETKNIVDSLELIGAKKGKLNAPKLEVVGKNLKLVDFSSGSLSSLSVVGGEATFTSVGSSDLSIPSIYKIGAPGLTISDSQQLLHAKFSNLTKIDGFLKVNKNPSLVSLDFSHLDSIKDGFSVDSPKLSELKAPYSIHGGGGFELNSAIDCKDLDKTKGHFSNFNCKTSEKQDPSKSHQNKPTDPKGNNGIQINCSRVTILMGSIIILYL